MKTPAQQSLTNPRILAALCIELVMVMLAIYLTTYLFYPGGMSSDSVRQFQEARSGIFTADHPPIMALLWRSAMRVTGIEGPGALFLVHAIVFWIGIWFLARNLLPNTCSRLLMLIFAIVLPSLFVQLSVIWKDTGLTCALIAACACLMRAEKSVHRLAWIGVAIIFLFYGLCVRHNAALAVAPIIFWIVLLASESKPLTKSLCYATLLIASLLIARSALHSALVSKFHGSLLQFTMAADLGALERATGKKLLPDYIARQHDRKMIDLYPAAGDPSASQLLPIIRWQTDDANEARDLRAKWLAAVLHYPLDYFLHRCTVFARILGFGERMQNGTYYGPSPRHPQANRIFYHPLTRIYFWVMGYLRHTFVFRGYTYVFLCSILLLFGIWYRRLPRGEMAMLASALAYSAGYFFIAPSDDFRYLYWPVAVTPIVIISVLRRAFFSNQLLPTRNDSLPN